MSNQADGRVSTVKLLTKFSECEFLDSNLMSIIPFKKSSQKAPLSFMVDPLRPKIGTRDDNENNNILFFVERVKVLKCITNLILTQILRLYSPAHYEKNKVSRKEMIPLRKIT